MPEKNSSRVDDIHSFDPKMGELEVLEPGIAMFHGFANVAFAYGRGEMLAVDTGSRQMGARAVAKIREVTQEPFAFLIYSRGHGEHAFGTEAFIADAMKRGFPRPKIWAHEDVADRFERYRLTRGWQTFVNRRQFGISSSGEQIFGDDSFNHPDLTYSGTQFLDLVSEPVELHHAIGPTDDATWVWMPARRLAMVGDLISSSMPNAGNPNKAQRFVLEWTQTLERIAHRKPRDLLPGCGPAYQGEQACQEVLTETARALRYVHDEVVRRLNLGQWPIDIVEANIALPDDLAAKPFLRPFYGCVSFVVRDVIRRYAGWWSGEPAQMLPVPRKESGDDIVALCGREAIFARARSLKAEGQLRRALALAEIALDADSSDLEARVLNAEILEAMAAVEESFIARNLLAAAARDLRNPTKK
jgi:alkyl sulfatase BDS1-like metallo-beta-lactamase superfamily hydrolase